MSDLTFGLFVRGQYHAGDDMRKRFEEVKAQVRLADQLGFSDLLTGMHYAAAPLQQYQMIPLLARLLAETDKRLYRPGEPIRIKAPELLTIAASPRRGPCKVVQGSGIPCRARRPA